MSELASRVKTYVPDFVMGIYRWIRPYIDFLRGLIVFSITKRTPESSYLSMLTLHCRTNGITTDLVGWIFSKIRPPGSIAAVTGAVGAVDSKQLEHVVDTIGQDGYFIFQSKLSEGLCDEIKNFASVVAANAETVINGKFEKKVFDPLSPSSKTYRIEESDLIRQPAVQDLMGDATIRAISEAYLKAQPVLVSVNLWWSPVFGQAPGEDAAQLYHFDFANNKWLKFFVYLTDVDATAGPHCFVRGSHRRKSPAGHALLKRGYVRLSDSDIAAAFGAENMLEFPGLRGTILAVDTAGFHKGKVPVSQHRLILELTYANSLFGGDYKRHDLHGVTPVLAEALTRYPYTYQRFQLK